MGNLSRTMSFEVVFANECTEELTSTRPSSCKKLRSCLRTFIETKDRKILLVAYGGFTLALGIALAIGYYCAIRVTTTTTVHTETTIATPITAAMVILTGSLFSFLAFYKARYLIIATIILSSISGIISAIGSMHYGTIAAERLTALSDCLYLTTQRLCTCSIQNHSSRVSYTFENTASCSAITSHLVEVVYGMCGVYAASFVVCFGATAYAVLLLHKNEIKKIKSQQQNSPEITKEPLPEKKQSFEELAPEFSAVSGAEKAKFVEPWQRDVATQTSDLEAKAESTCRHQCRHYVEVTVPNTSNDYVVNITKSRDPPPPYCETVYT